jgi:hypothetical protein
MIETKRNYVNYKVRLRAIHYDFLAILKRGTKPIIHDLQWFIKVIGPPT